MRIIVTAILLALAPGIVSAQSTPVADDFWTDRSQPILEAAFAGFPFGLCPGRVLAIDHSLGHVYRCDQVLSLSGDWLGALQFTEWGPGFYLGSTITAIAVDERTHRLFVVSGDMVKIVDGTTFFEIDSIPVMAYPNVEEAAGVTSELWGTPAVAYDPATGILYLGGYNLRKLWAVDPAWPAGHPNRVVSIPLAFEPATEWTTGVASLTIDHSTRRLFASSREGRNSPAMVVLDIDPARPTYHTVIDAMPLECTSTSEDSTAAFAIDRRRGVMFCASMVTKTLRAIDINPASVTYKTTLRETPLILPEDLGWGAFSTSIAYDPVRDLVYVAIDGYPMPPTLLAFDGATLALASLTSGPYDQDTYHEIAVDQESGRLYWARIFELYIYRQNAHATVAVQADYVVAPVTVQTAAVAITFTDVTGAGTTTVQPIDAAEANLTLPGQFSLAGAGAFEISTSAAVTAPFTLCFNASHVTDPVVFDTLVVLHGENNSWVDRTVSRDFATGTICAAVASFSPFAIGRRLPAHYQIVALYDQTKAARGGSTLPIKLRVLDAGGTNVSSAALEVSGRNLVRIANEATGAIIDSGNANPDHRFRYDATLGGYIFNLSTKGLAAGVYRLEFTAGADASVHSVFFGVK